MNKLFSIFKDLNVFMFTTSEENGRQNVYIKTAMQFISTQ